MLVRIVKITTHDGSFGQQLRVSCVLENVVPLRDSSKDVISMDKIAIIKNKKSKRFSSTRTGTLYEKQTSIFSTLQPMKYDGILRVGDEIEFCPDSFWGQAKGESVFINMQGNFKLSAEHALRVLDNPITTPTKQSTHEEEEELELELEDDTDDADDADVNNDNKDDGEDLIAF